MSKILLDYVFPISVIPATPAANSSFLKQVCVVCRPKSGQESNVGNVYECTSMADVVARTDSIYGPQQLFAAGMSKVYILLNTDLNIAVPLALNSGKFWTVLMTDDFSIEDILPKAAYGTVTFTGYAGGGNDIVKDTITVAGTVLTAVSGSPGPNEFTAAGTTAGTALNFCNAINNHVTLSELVTASVLNAVVTISSKKMGADGEAYTLAYHDFDDGMTVGASVSGANFAGDHEGLLVGDFDGVVGTTDWDGEDVFMARFASLENRCCFYSKTAAHSTNMFYAFGKLLSNLASWNNLQYISMPTDDGVTLLGSANTLFDERLSFVITDDDYGYRLGLFAAGGKAIVAPYISKNLRIDMQGRALQWIADNEPAYTKTNAALLQQRLQEDVINQKYIQTGLITAGTVEVKLVNDNFVANGEIDIAEPKALWRVFGEMRSTL